MLPTSHTVWQRCLDSNQRRNVQPEGWPHKNAFNSLSNSSQSGNLSKMTKIMQTLFLVHDYVKLCLQPVHPNHPPFASSFDQHVAWCRVRNQKGNLAISLSQNFKNTFNCYVQLLQGFCPPRKYQLVATLPAADTGLFIQQGGQLICLGGHFEKVAFSGGPHLPMKIEAGR